MSHIVKIEAKITDLSALRHATNRLGLDQPTFGTTKLFSNSATGWQVQLPGWRYPVVADIESGDLAYDNYEQRWGAQKELDRLIQAYAVAKCTLEARRQGHAVLETPLENGSVKLTIGVGGIT